MPVSIDSACLISTMMLPHYTNATGGLLSHLPLLLVIIHECCPTADAKTHGESGRKKTSPGANQEKTWFHCGSTRRFGDRRHAIAKHLSRALITSRKFIENFSDLDFGDAKSRDARFTSAVFTRARSGMQDHLAHRLASGQHLQCVGGLRQREG